MAFEEVIKNALLEKRKKEMPPPFKNPCTSLLMGSHSVTIEKFVKQSKQKWRYSTLEGGINDKLLALT